MAYAWSYGLSGSQASHARVEKVTYPDGRQIYYNYEAGAQFKNLGRVANIADCDSDDPADANTYVAYSYLGAEKRVRTILYAFMTNS